MSPKEIATVTKKARLGAPRRRAASRVRIAGGRHASVLADFLIGAHAVELGATLVTRDKGRFSTYFPDLTLITPETHP